VLAWAAGRFYYFLFYVLERYVDPALRYAGIIALVRTILRAEIIGRRGLNRREHAAGHRKQGSGAAEAEAFERIAPAGATAFGFRLDIVGHVCLSSGCRDGKETRGKAGGRDLDVAYTPGHASHHVSYFSADAGIAFVGDTAGVRLQAGRFIMPPTPPPDIDLEAWRDSLARIAAWHPETVFITHFGPYAPVAAHLTEMADHLELTSGLVKASLAREGSDETREAWFTDEIRRELRRRMTESDAHAYEVAGRFDLSWLGLARYWRKRG
jgi:glyoxylase-like metal-dependent hydrolase (beta-lactamase superfamily II)